MAESVVSFAAERIADSLISEARFLGGVKGEVESLADELKRMKCFLRDAESRQQQDERVRNWVGEIRDLACDAEDAIDTFLLHTSYTVTALITRPYHLHKIGNKIQSIRAKLAEISASLQTYGVAFVNEGEGSNLTQRRLRRSYPDEEDEHVIRLDSTAREVLAQLMMEDERVRVVSILGMGGLGKTTLAKLIYNHNDVKQHFDCSSWVFLSQQFSPEDVLFGILKDVGGTEDRQKWGEMKEEEIIKALKDALNQKRYLVVLDDIWNEVSWDSLKRAFPKGKTGSKVLLTSRIKDVALYADPWSSPIEPPLLTVEQGWELFKKKAFREEEGCTDEFEMIGKEVVRKCGGLPLAIVVLAGLLANKSRSEWEKVQRDMSAHLNKLQQRSQYAGVEWILSLSYQDLPSRLKPCFLYLSQFPEDSEFQKRKLVRKWIAEGFIPNPMADGSGEENMEDVGEQYLEELANRCMVQVSERDHTGFGIKKCKMHDLMRDMCVSKAKQENFLRIITKHGENEDSSSATWHLKSRRIACHSGASLQVPFKQHGIGNVRSLLSFGEERGSDGGFTLKKFKLLRVLESSRYTEYRILPRQIGNLIHLRYLRIVTPEKVPASIGNLRSLCTLDLRQSGHYIRLPNVLWKLGSLRHLLVGIAVIGEISGAEFRLDTLKHLETLKWVDAKILIRKDAMSKLTNLRHLKVRFVESEEVVFLRSPIVGLGRLRSLVMDLNSEGVPFSFPNLEPLSACDRLTKLELLGVILEEEGKEESLKFLPASLTKLVLSHSKLKKDPMIALEKLPSLRILSLKSDAYEGLEMVCSRHGFPKLEVLKLLHLYKLEEWRVEEGALPCLKNLVLKDLNLQRMPDGLKFVKTLKDLTLDEMEYELKRRIEVINGVEGEDFHKVRHIPSIKFFIPTTSS